MYRFLEQTEHTKCEHSLKSLHMLCSCLLCLQSRQLNVFLVAQSVLSKKESKISFSDWPALDIDFSNTISSHRGGRKQSWAASCFRHVLLTLAGLLSGGGSLFLNATNHRIDIMHRRFTKNQKVFIQ